MLPCNSGNLFGVCPDVSLFTSNSVHLWPLFLFVGLLGQESVNLAYALKNPAHRLIDSLYCFSVSVSLVSALVFIIYCSQVDLGLVCSCFSRVLSFLTKSCICDPSDFLT